MGCLFCECNGSVLIYDSYDDSKLDGPFHFILSSPFFPSPSNESVPQSFPIKPFRPLNVHSGLAETDSCYRL